MTINFKRHLGKDKMVLVLLAMYKVLHESRLAGGLFSRTLLCIYNFFRK